MSTDTLTSTIEESVAAKADAGETVPAAAAITAAAEQLKPKDQPLPGFEPPAFDFAAALHSIAAKNRAVAEAKFEWKSSAEETARLKKIYDREVDGLSAIIRDCADRERNASPRLVQGSLASVASGVAASSCRFEQLRNVACPGCILLRKAGCLLPDPEDTEHYDAVVSALAEWEDPEIGDGIEQTNGQIVDGDTIASWTPEQRQAVQLWINLCGLIEGGAIEPEPPAVLGTPHVADVAGDHVQSCKRCGSVILDLSKPDVDAYDEDDRVGVNCDAGDEADADEPTSAAAALEETLAEHKVCLCETPDFLIPIDSTDPEDARCTKCEGAPTGGIFKVRYAKAPTA